MSLKVKLFKKRPSKRGSLVDLSSIGIGKQKVPKEDEVKKAKDQHQQKQQWRKDLNRLENIVNRLKSTFADSKTRFTVNKYKEIKKMIKDTVKNYKDFNQQIEEGENCEQLDKADGCQKTGGKKGGLMARFKKKPHTFVDLEFVEEPEKDFAAMPLKEFEAELETMKEDVLQLKGEFHAISDRLEWLGTEYENSKRYKPAQRYKELTNIVKVVTGGGELPSGKSPAGQDCSS